MKVTTKSNGEFSFTDIVPGTYTLHARRIGYAEAVMRVDVEEGEKRDVSFALSKATVLDSVAVSATPLARDQALRGFEEHRKLGLGNGQRALDGVEELFSALLEDGAGHSLHLREGVLRSRLRPGDVEQLLVAEDAKGRPIERAGDRVSPRD